MWTEAKERIIAQMWADGHPARIIGERVGKTRNAVIGKLGRMGLIGLPEENRKRAVERACANRKRKEARARTAKAVLVPEAPKPPLPELPPPDGIRLEDLTNTTCRWPLLTQSPQRFCGAYTECGPYCAEHKRRAFQAGSGRHA